jgi:hypothetical protein
MSRIVVGGAPDVKLPINDTDARRTLVWLQEQQSGILAAVMSEESTTSDLVALQKRLTEAANRRELRGRRLSTSAMELAFACSFRRAVLSAAAVRFSCDTQPYEARAVAERLAQERG